MKYRVWKLLLILFICDVISLSAQQKVSVLGDSYSTFIGHVFPSTNAVWYGHVNTGKNSVKNDVKKVEQTWWGLLASQKEYVLELNNSYSGSTVCHTGYDRRNFSDRSFITRIHNLGNPDIILIFGGTNDSWAGVPIGESQYEKWTNKDLFNFRPAFCYLLHHLKVLYPETEIYNITNSELSKEVTSSMQDICDHYGITNIQLHDIEKQAGHPSKKGMKSICEQVVKAIKSNTQKK